MACNARSQRALIIWTFWCLMTYWQACCLAVSSSHHRHSSSTPSKNKKLSTPPPPRIGHPPPAAFPKPPTLKPGQLPLSVVESEAAFSLYYGRNFKVVQNYFYNLTYLLLEQVGESNMRDWDLNISVFQDPLINFTVDTNAAVGFLELLGCVGKLRGLPMSFGLASPCIMQLIWQGEIPTIMTSSTDPNVSNITIAFEALFGPSNIAVPLASNEQNMSNFVSFDALIDQGPLQRAEWIKFIAAFFNLEERANDVYAQVERNYQCLNASVKGVNSSKPLVAWLSYNVDVGIWTFSSDPYKLQLTSDAGGLNLDPPTLSMSLNMSEELDISNFYNISSALDLVVDETYAINPSTYTWENFTAAAKINDMSLFPFLANKRLWRYDKRVGINHASDWLEGAVVQPQVVLGDLIKIFFPASDDQGSDNTTYNITYFRNLLMEENIVNTSTLSCARTDMTSVLEPTILPCTSVSVL